MHTEWNAWQRWVHQPQNLWFRKAFFQIHLWVGIGIGLYILAISISGAAVVFARELTLRYRRQPVILTPTGPRLSADELTQAAERAYPGYKVVDIAFARRPDLPAMVALTKIGRGDNSKRTERLINQYTGAPLGDPLTPAVHVIQWFVDFHDNLLAGQEGRLANGIGAIFVTILSLTGAVLWWPGKKEWRRSLKVSWKAGLPRLNWDLHSAMGFWCFLFIFLWGFSGIYFSFPQPFNAAAEFLFPDKPGSRQLSFGDQALFWLSKLHFGRFGWQLEAVWVVFGLVPAAMLVTGALMWWNRSLRKIKYPGRVQAQPAPNLADRRPAPGSLTPALQRKFGTGAQ